MIKVFNQSEGKKNHLMLTYQKTRDIYIEDGLKSKV